MSTTLGVTLACFDDIGALGEVCETDEQETLDEVYHRLTTDSVLGDSDDARSWGYNLRARINAATIGDELLLLNPKLSAVLERSGRVDTAEVNCTELPATAGKVSMRVEVYVAPTSNKGPYAWIFELNGDTFKRVGAGES